MNKHTLQKLFTATKSGIFLVLLSLLLIPLAFSLSLPFGIVILLINALLWTASFCAFAFSSIPSFPYSLAYWFHKGAIEQAKEQKNENEDAALPANQWKAFRKKALEKLHANAKKEQILSHDGKTRLCAYLWENKNSTQTAVLCHGYAGSPDDLAGSAALLHDLGFSVLLVCSRSFGFENAKICTFGYQESKDLLDWISWIKEKYPRNKVMLYGVSLGASSLMQAAADLDPEQVKAAAADCGFTSVKEQILYGMRTVVKIPVLLLPWISVWFLLLGRYSLEQTDCRPALQKTKVPFLFIHGKNDTFIPVSNTLKNAKACRSVSKTVLAEGAAHAQSVSMAPQIFWPNVISFLKEKGFDLDEDIANRILS